MNFSDYVTPENFVIVVALVGIGMFIKSIEIIKDKYIPIILLAVSMLYMLAVHGINADSFVQGVILASTAVFSNQTVKQLGKGE